MIERESHKALSCHQIKTLLHVYVEANDRAYVYTKRRAGPSVPRIHELDT